MKKKTDYSQIDISEKEKSEIVGISECVIVEIEKENISKKELIEMFIKELIDKEGEENTIYRTAIIKGIIKYDIF